LRSSRPNRRESLTFRQKRTSGSIPQLEDDGRAGVYMREGTTLKVMAADRSYGEFCDFYSVSPEYLDTTT
jgi:hypothetical protein